LEQSSTTKDVVVLHAIVVVHASWAKMNPVGIIKQLSHFFCSSIPLLIDIQRDVNMPALLARRKQENIVKSRICVAQLADALESTALKSQDNISFVRHLLRPISRNDHGNFIGSRDIISSAICALPEMNACTNICLFLWSLLSHNLIGLLVQRSIEMISIQHVMETPEDDTVKTLISWSGGVNVGGFCRVIYI
jgi:hypothetical protein